MKNIVVLGIILLLALTLRLYNLDKNDLWYDETFNVLHEWGLDRLPSFNKLLDGDFLIKNQDYLKFYTHGFVFYWQKFFGKSEFVLRLSSVIFALLSIAFLYLFVREIFGVKTAYLTSFLLAISPFSVYYSQELTPYSAISLLTLFATYSFLKILKTSEKKYFLIYVISNILNIYLHYLTFFVLLSFLLFFIFKLKEYKYLLKKIFVIHIIILIFLIPMALSIYPNLKLLLQHTIDPDFSEFPIWRERIPFKILAFTFKNFSIGYNLDYFSILGKFAFVLYFILFLIGVYKNIGRLELRLFLVCFLFPIFLLFFVSQFKVCYVDRYFFSVFPFYLVIVGLGIKALTKRVLLVSIVLIIMSLNLFGLKNYYLYSLPRDHMQHIGVVGRQHTRGIAEVISKEYKKGDRILHTCRNTVFPLKFYIKYFSSNEDLNLEVDRGTVIFIPTFLKNKSLFNFDYNMLHPYSFSFTEYKPIKELERNDRIWLVFSSWYFMDLNMKEYEVVKIIKNNFKEDKTEEFEGVKLYLFTKITKKEVNKYNK